jgi:hypothetical protein
MVSVCYQSAYLAERPVTKELLKLKQKQTTLVLCQKEMHGQLILVVGQIC